MSTVAMTGASGYLGRKLCLLLDSDDSVKRVIGVDLAEPTYSTGNLEFYRMDVTSPDLGAVIAECDAIVHLAPAGTREVMRVAAESQTRKIVIASSGAVYGAHADNDVPLTEDSPLRPAAGYGKMKADAEEIVASFASSNPDATVTVLRLGWVCGPTIPGPAATVVESLLRLVIDGYEPAFQALHEDDAARALAFVLRNDVPGVYNVAATDQIDDIDAFLGQRRITLDRATAERFRDTAGPLWPFASDLGVLMHPQVMSNARFRMAGFEVERTTADAIREGAESRRGWISIGKLRFRPRRVAVAAVSTIAVMAASAARVITRRPA